MAKTVNARTLPVQSIGYKYGKLIIPPYEVDVEFTPKEQAALESGINANMIPSAAGANNPLADQQYVDDAVSTYSAQFLGTSALGLTEQQFLAWANTLDADNNDYCNWWTTDTDGKTIYKRYKYNGTQWLFEYNVADPSSVPTALSQLTDDANHRLVTDTEKSTWNGKVDPTDLATVATSGSYDDLENKPTIPAAQIQSDWNQRDNSKADYIKNKPTIPTVPTNVGAFTNDAGYLTQHQDISGKADIGTAQDAKTVNSLYGAKAYSKDLVDTSEYKLRNLSAILAFATGTGTVTLTTNPEWKLVLVDYANKILLGKRRDNTWYFPEDLDDLLDQVIADYGN